MKALVYDEGLRYQTDYPEPELRPGWAVVRVHLAGVCRTDIEITKGYMSFRGVPGHEFVGTVAQCCDESLLDQRVVGEINAACGECPACRKGMERHCPNRTVLGIQGLDGCMAERCTLPTRNLHRVPDDVTDAQAVFVEPLAAAHRILEQAPVTESTRCIVLGDGKLGILCAWALGTASKDVTLVGHHERKLRRAQWNGIETVTSLEAVRPAADLVVEATGSGEGLMQSLALVRPRGCLVLKSTIVSQGELNLAEAVVKEINIVGSRCGPFDRALAAMSAYRFPVERLIDARMPIEEGESALAEAAERGTLKVLLEMGCRAGS